MKKFRLTFETKNGNKVEDIETHGLCSASVVCAGRLTKPDYSDCTKVTIEEIVSCPYCNRTEPCKGSYPEGCLHPKAK
jgi:hypothetical protein